MDLCMSNFSSSLTQSSLTEGKSSVLRLMATFLCRSHTLTSNVSSLTQNCYNTSMNAPTVLLIKLFIYRKPLSIIFLLKIVSFLLTALSGIPKEHLFIFPFFFFQRKDNYYKIYHCKIKVIFYSNSLRE